MATKTASDETMNSPETKLEELKRLDAESRGDWVKCICTDVDEDDLSFRFETFHGRTTTKSFTVPDTLADSDVQAFFEDVGYAPENAALMGGEEFWMHMEDRSITDTLPSKWRQKMPSRSSLIPPHSHEVLPSVFAAVGAIIFFPIFGLYWVLWEQSPEGDGEPLAAVFVSMMVTSIWIICVLVVHSLIFL